MSEIARSIDQVIRGGLAPALKAAGFRKDGRTFRRREAECIQIVNAQGSQWNAPDEGRFTLNLGVYFPVMALYLDRMRETDRPMEADCIARERIGRLMPGGLDHWWGVTPRTDLPALALEVQGVWEDVGLPWLETHTDLRAVRELVRRQNTPYWAAAISLALGEPDQARVYFAEAIASFGPEISEAAWLQEWGMRHGIASAAAV